jgi:3-hydroxybutyryl-CoA dehydrogenase
MTDAPTALTADTSIGVIGAGAMGGGIAMVAAAAGHTVCLFDAAPQAAARAMKRFEADLERLVGRGRLDSAEAKARLARIQCVETLQGLADCGLVIEAVIEDMDIKSGLLGSVEALLGPDALLTTNTSSLSVTALGGRLKRPEKFAGLHFFNPATVMPLVEVVSGAMTDAACAATLRATVLAWGKTPVLCRSTPGFIVNRVARPFYGEALRALELGAAEPATVDAVMRESGGFRMGPLELMDLIGHDVNFAVTSSVYDAFFQDPRYRPSLIQKELVLAGRLGRKTDRGFYAYGADAVRAAPIDAPAAPRPDKVVVQGDLGPAVALAGLAREAGLDVETTQGDGRPLVETPDGDGRLIVDGLALTLTDGRTATARGVHEGPIALFDLAIDYAKTPRIAVAFGDGVTEAHRGAAIGFFQALGKAVSVVDDIAAMLVMRTVSMLANEAADALQQGLAGAADLDLAMVAGANYPLGPLAWADRLGAARIVAVLDALAAFSPDGRYRCSPLLRRRAVSGRPIAETRSAP